MTNSPMGARGGAGAVLTLFLLALLGVFLGLTSAVLPAWFVLSMLMVPAIAVVLLVRPEYALVACVALVCGLVHPSYVPRIPVLGRALSAADATLMMLAVYAVLTFIAQRSKETPVAPAGSRWLVGAFGLFSVGLVFAVVWSLWIQDLKTSFVLGETRDLLYFMVFPIALVILRSPVRQQRLVVGLVVLGCLFAVGQILQGMFNLPVFGAQGLSALETLGRTDAGTTRSNTLGLNVLILALLLTLGAYALGSLRKLYFFPLAALLMVGIVLTYGRTTYVAVLICGLMVVWWLNREKLPQLTILLVVALLLGAAGAYLWKPESVAAVYFRMTSIGAELDHGYSAQWRIWEAEAMLPHIKQNPLTGIGLGADYKGVTGAAGHPELNRYVHNAYLYMAGKMGLPTLAAFLVFMAAVFAIGRRNAKRNALTWQRVVGAAGAAMMVRFVLASITEPHLMSDYGVIVIALVAAMVYRASEGNTSAEAPGVAGPSAHMLRSRQNARAAHRAVAASVRAR